MKIEFSVKKFRRMSNRGAACKLDTKFIFSAFMMLTVQTGFAY
jgi:hypothetical protein